MAFIYLPHIECLLLVEIASFIINVFMLKRIYVKYYCNVKTFNKLYYDTKNSIIYILPQIMKICTRVSARLVLVMFSFIQVVGVYVDRRKIKYAYIKFLYMN